jgi:hypothetical protein
LRVVDDVKRALYASCAALLISCIAPVPDDPEPAMDERVIDSIGDFTSWDEINTSRYESELGPYEISVWTNSDGDEYRRIHPETTGSHVVIPVGAIIVRAVFDARGAIEKLTLMAKGPPGYDPRIGDWWFGVTDARGSPVEVGHVEKCFGCHIPRAADDYLFGVPSGI